MNEETYHDFKIMYESCEIGKFRIEAKKIHKDVLDEVLLSIQQFSEDDVFKNYIYDETPEYLLKKTKENIDKFHAKRKHIEGIILMKYIQAKFIKRIKEIREGELYKNEQRT